MLFIYLVWLFDRTVSESALLFIYIQSSLLVWNPVFSQEQIYPKGSLNLIAEMDCSGKFDLFYIVHLYKYFWMVIKATYIPRHYAWL